ncbi:MAG: chemotaxis response regulator protein-glutamate methylesterase [Parachlamydia sp.]|nr:chemotaxis response regulator protein-glutamate methylesterase [Parachlamydia sp.]
MRIAIVNDMKMTVEMLRRVITASSHQVAWVAYDGAEAVEKCARDRPDLILMDLIMPVMDGAEATRLIMEKSPCAILIVTATVMGNASKVFEAMGFGALDVTKTPVMSPKTQTVDSKELMTKIDRIATLIRPVKQHTTKAQEFKEEISGLRPPLLLIGASTGGPKALVEVLSGLPAHSSFATLIIQHVDQDFSAGLADWLSKETGQVVKIAEAGMRPQAGLTLLAGRNDHLIMEKEGILNYTEDPIDNPYRPSVDVFFNSVAACWQKMQKDKGLAVLLTGMGADGAKGMKNLRDSGWHTIAQDQKSSVVFGMPKAAIALNAAKVILPLTEISKEIVDYFNRNHKV